EELHEVAGGDHVDATGADQVEGAGVDAGDVRVRVAGHVLHGHLAGAAHQSRHARFEFLPAQVNLGRAGQVVQCPRFDPVDELARLAVCRNEIEPAAGQHGLIGQADHPTGQHVKPAEIVEQPTVKPELAEGGLNGGEVEHGGPPWLLVSYGAAARKGAVTPTSAVEE